MSLGTGDRVRVLIGVQYRGATVHAVREVDGRRFALLDCDDPVELTLQGQDLHVLVLGLRQLSDGSWEEMTSSVPVTLVEGTPGAAS